MTQGDAHVHLLDVPQRGVPHGALLVEMDGVARHHRPPGLLIGGGGGPAHQLQWGGEVPRLVRGQGGGEIATEIQLFKGNAVVGLQALAHQRVPDGALLGGVAHRAGHRHHLVAGEGHGGLKGGAVDGRGQHHRAQAQGGGVETGALETVAIGQLVVGLTAHLGAQIQVGPHHHRAGKAVGGAVQQAELHRHAEGIGGVRHIGEQGLPLGHGDAGAVKGADALAAADGLFGRKQHRIISFPGMNHFLHIIG